MRRYWYDLADAITAKVRDGEVLTCCFRGEASEFVRLSGARIRQAGHVLQRTIELDLSAGLRHAGGTCTLSGRHETDLARLLELLATLRTARGHLVDDPHLHYATTVQHSKHLQADGLPPGPELAHDVATMAQGLDLVGILASGPVYTGFANSMGQRNWHEWQGIQLDWSLCGPGEKAVKATFAGNAWDREAVAQRIEASRRDLERLLRPARSIPRGRYRAYLAPAALEEILGLLAWEAFSSKRHATRQTPLLALTEGEASLSPAVSLCEHHGAGRTPPFTRTGFAKPRRVELIRNGTYGQSLVNARSAREFGLEVNADIEIPQSLELAGGDLPAAAIAQELHDGLWINNLWYTNFSDRNRCRITGMTRFACFWVQQGRVEEPIEAMRFDESLYQLLGSNLIALTRERTLLADPATYEQRSQRSVLLPGALVEDFTLTL